MAGGSGFSRRGLLGGVTGLGASIWVPRLVLAQDHSGHSAMSPALGRVARKPLQAMDAPLIEPEVRRSANGVLQTKLNCAYAYREIGGVRITFCCREQLVHAREITDVEQPLGKIHANRRCKRAAFRRERKRAVQ